MIVRYGAAVCLIALAGCAGLEPVGRNAGRGPSATEAPAPISPRPEAAPTRATSPVATPPALPTPAPRTEPVAPLSPRLEAAPTRANPGRPGDAAPVPAPNINAPLIAAPAVSPPARAASTPRDDDDIVVPGTAVERQISPPNGDPRSMAERMEDIRAWDQCVTHVQAAYERNPTRPQLDSPEEYCGRSLGMAERTAIPESRLERRR